MAEPIRVPIKIEAGEAKKDVKAFADDATRDLKKIKTEGVPSVGSVEKATKELGTEFTAAKGSSAALLAQVRQIGPQGKPSVGMLTTAMSSLGTVGIAAVSVALGFAIDQIREWIVESDKAAALANQIKESLREEAKAVATLTSELDKLTLARRASASGLSTSAQGRQEQATEARSFLGEARRIQRLLNELRAAENMAFEGGTGEAGRRPGIIRAELDVLRNRTSDFRLTAILDAAKNPLGALDAGQALEDTQALINEYAKVLSTIPSIEKEIADAEEVRRQNALKHNEILRIRLGLLDDEARLTRDAAGADTRETKYTQDDLKRTIGVFSTTYGGRPRVTGTKHGAMMDQLGFSMAATPGFTTGGTDGLFGPQQDRTKLQVEFFREQVAKETEEREAAQYKLYLEAIQLDYDRGEQAFQDDIARQNQLAQAQQQLYQGQAQGLTSSIQSVMTQAVMSGEFDGVAAALGRTFATHIVDAIIAGMIRAAGVEDAFEKLFSSIGNAAAPGGGTDTVTPGMTGAP